MARKGGNPKIAEYGKKTRFGAERGCDAVKAAEKSNEVQAAIKPLRELLKEQCSEDDRRQMNKNLIRMAKYSIRAYELLMKALGEDPGQKLEVSGSVDFSEVIAQARERAKNAATGDG